MKMSVITRTFRALWPRRRTVGLIVAAAGVLSVACDSPAEPRVLASITLTPSAATLALNGTQQFAAAGADAMEQSRYRLEFTRLKTPWSAG